jgi:hypothetical protein
MSAAQTAAKEPHGRRSILFRRDLRFPVGNALATGIISRNNRIGREWRAGPCDAPDVRVHC